MADDDRDDRASDTPGDEQVISHGPAGRALSTSVHGNSTAFGFSITITATFGMLTHVLGSPSVGEVLTFAIAAALAIAALDGAVTRGFRTRAAAAPPEVQLLGTALNFVSVGTSVALSLAIGKLLDGAAAWPLGSAVASATYIVVEAAGIAVAEPIQRARGDRHAGDEEDDD